MSFPGLVRQGVRAVGLLLLATSAAARGSTDHVEGAIREVFDRLRDDEKDNKIAARRLAELGEAVVVPLFAMDCGDWEPEYGPVRPNERAIVDRALETLKSGAVIRRVMGSVGDDTDLNRRLVAAAWIGAVGGADGVEPIVELFSGLSPNEQQQPRLNAPFRDALSTVLRRDAFGCKVLRRMLRDDAVPESFLPLAADALGSSGQDAALDGLRALLAYERPGLAESVIEALGNSSAESDAAELVLELMGDSDPDMRRAGARALGQLAVPESISSLIELLQDSDRRVQRSAKLALSALSGLPVSDRVERWRSWLNEESEWYDAHWAEYADAAFSGERARAIQALRELGRHPLYQLETVRALEEIGSHEDELVVRASCGVLAGFDSLAARQLLEVLRE